MAKSGGHVRKGEKSEIVVFWKIQPIEEEKDDDTKEVKQIRVFAIVPHIFRDGYQNYGMM